MSQANWEILLGTFMGPVMAMFYVVMFAAFSWLSTLGESEKRIQKRCAESALVMNLFLPTFFLGWVAFFDHLIHRAGVFLLKNGSEWEKWLATLVNSKFSIVLADIVWGMPLFLMYVFAVRNMKKYEGWQLKNTENHWIAASLITTVLAFGAVIFVKTIAGK
jgi:hypothetical protein